MVGLSTNRQKASYFVATYLKYMGYRIIPVHPKADTIIGEKAYPMAKEIATRPADARNDTLCFWVEKKV